MTPLRIEKCVFVDVNGKVRNILQQLGDRKVFFHYRLYLECFQIP